MTKKSMRWGTATPASRDVARDLLLDAAEACLEGKGPAGTTMEDIRQAGGGVPRHGVSLLSES